MPNLNARSGFLLASLLVASVLGGLGGFPTASAGCAKEFNQEVCLWAQATSPDEDPSVSACATVQPEPSAPGDCGGPLVTIDRTVLIGRVVASEAAPSELLSQNDPQCIGTTNVRLSVGIEIAAIGLGDMVLGGDDVCPATSERCRPYEGEPFVIGCTPNPAICCLVESLPSGWPVSPGPVTDPLHPGFCLYGADYSVDVDREGTPEAKISGGLWLRAATAAGCDPV